MFFDHYPYTNFHNVNLDWVLQAVKAWGRTVEANDQAFQDLEEANEDFKRYVRNYLQNLDITDEINTKLDAMLASGVLTPYFAPYVKGYVDSWLASHVTPTSPALDSTLTLSGAAARADSTGHRLKDLAYIDALSTPEIIAALNRSQVLPGYRVQGIAYDYDGHYYVCGGSVDETGTGVIVKMTKPDFTDAEITEIPQLGHANDITYYDGYLYVCTVGGGDAPQWGIYKINVNDFTDKTLISNAPENTIGISYRQGDFWILAPYRIYRTTDFSSYEVVVANTNDLLTAYGIPTSGRISQTLFRAAGYLIGWVCSFVFEDRHYGALTFFNSTGEPVAFKMFPAYHSEIQGAVYADMSIYLLADGNLVNVFRMDPRNLSYVQLKAGDDLNDFTGRGTLYSTGSNVSAELLNSPSSGEGFTVQVDRLGVYNTIQTARTNSGRELYRVKSFSAGTWGEWIEPAAEVSQIKEDLSHIETSQIIGMTPTQRTVESSNLFSKASLVARAKYVDRIANGKAVLVDSTNLDTYILPVDGESTYTFTNCRTAVLVSDLEYTAVGSLLTYTTEINSTGGTYILFSFNRVTYPVDSYSITKPVTVYKIPSFWDVSRTAKQDFKVAKGENLKINGLSAVKYGEKIVFKGYFDTFAPLTLHFRNYNNVSTNSIEVNTESILIKQGSTVSATLPHGLTLAHDITLLLDYRKEGVSLTLTSDGNAYTNTLSFGQLTTAAVCPEIVSTGTLTDAILTQSLPIAGSDIWYLGDSYISITNNARWAYHLLENGFGNNVLFNGYAGAPSTVSIWSFNALLDYGTPKMAVFGTGMNDGSDGADAPASSWASRRDDFINICISNGIEPIFATVPTVPTVNNEQKNIWVRNSGYRYIDFAKAVGADGTGVWYSGMLSTDNVHPSVQGAVALYTQAITDMPELLT